jgi:hypothetical protein
MLSGETNNKLWKPYGTHNHIMGKIQSSTSYHVKVGGKYRTTELEVVILVKTVPLWGWRKNSK